MDGTGVAARVRVRVQLQSTLATVLMMMTVGCIQPTTGVGSTIDAKAADDAHAVDDAHEDSLGTDAMTGKSSMTFFVTSTGSGPAGGNLGGVAGADTKCQQLAIAVGGGDHTWAAYLGTQGSGGQWPIQRIGVGPWRNQKGVEIAANITTLVTNNVTGADMVDERGDPVPVSERVILTGAESSTTHGRVTFGNGTCTNWTSTNGVVAVGHTDSDSGVTLGPDEAPYHSFLWDSGSYLNPGCSAAQLAANKSSGRIYCFAKD
jgi:hypothetical protein